MGLQGGIKLVMKRASTSEACTGDEEMLGR
jgi:hypothetical protein